MSPPQPKLEWQRALSTLAGLAIFLAFVMGAVVAWLRRRRFGRVPAVLTSVAVALLIALVAGGLIGWQLSRLADSLPDYTENIKKKVGSAREWVFGTGE